MKTPTIAAIAGCIVCAAAPGLAGAENLLDVFRDARSYDAQYAAARFTLQAGMERLPQGRALVLPTLNLTGNATATHFQTDPRGGSPVPGVRRDFQNYGYTLTFTQPVFRRQNEIQYSQAGHQVRQAEATFGLAGQDLVLRVSQAYFDVLAAQDTLALVGAQKVAINEQLAQAKRNFEVGTATITDTHEAQARFDLIVAQEIAARNDLDNKNRVLQQLTGKEYAALKPLRRDVVLSGPNPAGMQSWVDLAEKQSFPVQIQEALSEFAALEAKRNRAGNLPTVDFVATLGQSIQSASSISAFGTDITSATVGLQLALPLYTGGAVDSRTREAIANHEKVRQDLENARRSGATATRQAYLSVSAGIAQVKALEQALVSSQSALESNRLGYEVGVRINIDVLNAQQQLFSTRRDLALARYNTITNHLKLKAAAGSLREEDLEEVNRALEP